MTTLTKLISRFAALMATVALAVGLTIATASPASAEPVEGQHVDKSGLHCGGQAVQVGKRSLGAFGVSAEIARLAWVYYNCGDQTVRRYAAVGGWTGDGTCYGIGPGKARVLFVITWNDPGIYQGSKAC